MLNQIFRFAKRKGYISDPPVIAIPSSRQNSRPDISETEWRTLYTYLRKYVKEAQDKRRYRERGCEDPPLGQRTMPSMVPKTRPM